MVSEKVGNAIEFSCSVIFYSEKLRQDLFKQINHMKNCKYAFLLTENKISLPSAKENHNFLFYSLLSFSLLLHLIHPSLTLKKGHKVNQPCPTTTIFPQKIVPFMHGPFSQDTQNYIQLAAILYPAFIRISSFSCSLHLKLINP